tara:strand:+ start:508 stop:1011 length:504 start_codon:yes stop_codon:yes gene_type:complete
MSTIFLKEEIKKIILEQNKKSDDSGVEKTRAVSGGRYKKEIEEAGALAEKNPGELMKRLKVGNIKGPDDITKLSLLLKSATGNSEAMTTVYGEPTPRQHTESKKKGVRIPVKVIPPRDARRYIIHTMVGAMGANIVKFDQNFQIELLGNDVLVYFSNKEKSWHKKEK